VRIDAKTVGLASAAALVLCQAACDRPGTLPARQAQAGGEPSDPGYHAAPLVNGVAKAADGAVSLSGRALPSSTVRLAAQARTPIEARADGSGAWTAALGLVSEPALYALTEEAGGQTVEAEGVVAVLPGVPTVALLRAGFGAQVMQDASAAPLRIQAVDYDAAGAAVVSGRAHAASPVRVIVDDQPPIEGVAGPDGRFSLTLPKPLPPGRHRLQVMTPQATSGSEVAITPPASPRGATYHALAEPFGWRVDWITPGGGVQTTLFPAG
jgi:hypothetical protein